MFYGRKLAVKLNLGIKVIKNYTELKIRGEKKHKIMYFCTLLKKTGIYAVDSRYKEADIG